MVTKTIAVIKGNNTHAKLNNNPCKWLTIESGEYSAIRFTDHDWVVDFSNHWEIFENVRYAAPIAPSIESDAASSALLGMSPAARACCSRMGVGA